MKVKFKEILCGIALSLCMCATCNASRNRVGAPPQITYSTILGNVDELIADVSGEDADWTIAAQFCWAEEILDMMAANHLTLHWLDDEPANLELMDQIFDESLNATKFKHPLLRDQLDNPDVRRAISSALGLEV